MPTDDSARRTLVLCFDGTANEYGGDNTNVVKFFSLLKKDDFDVQLCYYQASSMIETPGETADMCEFRLE